MCHGCRNATGKTPSKNSYLVFVHEQCRELQTRDLGSYIEKSIWKRGNYYGRPQLILFITKTKRNKKKIIIINKNKQNTRKSKCISSIRSGRASGHKRNLEHNNPAQHSNLHIRLEWTYRPFRTVHSVLTEHAFSHETISDHELEM